METAFMSLSERLGKALGTPSICRHCNSSDLFWFHAHTNTGVAQDGCLRMHEIATSFVLGCRFCSETLKIVPTEKVANVLTELILVEKAADKVPA